MFRSLKKSVIEKKILVKALGDICLFVLSEM